VTSNAPEIKAKALPADAAPISGTGEAIAIAEAPATNKIIPGSLLIDPPDRSYGF
jgi:hypothetical protein